MTSRVSLSNVTESEGDEESEGGGNYTTVSYR